MDYRTILATGFLLLCGSVFVHSLKSANASMPVGMQHGQFPYENFSTTDGTLPNLPNGSTHDILTVPNDRLFILTNLITNQNCDLYVDGNKKLINLIHRIDHSSVYHPSSFHLGNVHLIINSGETLSLVSTNNNCYTYHLEGYYAHP